MKKYIYLLLISLFVFTSCNQTDEIFDANLKNDSIDKSKNEKVMICHNNHVIEVSINALEAHLAHGDIIGDCSIPDTPPEIGDFYQGGLVFYILQPDDLGYDADNMHGLIAAETDQSDGAAWGCFGTFITGANGVVIGTGSENTINILNGCSDANIAASICDNLILNEYDDWFLPSIDELKAMYTNLHLKGLGEFVPVEYWSSSAVSLNWGRAKAFNFGFQGLYDRNSFLRVRAVRAF